MPPKYRQYFKRTDVPLTRYAIKKIKKDIERREVSKTHVNAIILFSV